MRKAGRRKTFTAPPDNLDRNAASDASRHSSGNDLANAWDDVRRDQMDFDDQVVAALDQLSSEARACLLLRTVEELPYRDIGALLDIPENTAMSHVHRAKRRIREQLRDTYCHR